VTDVLLVAATESELGGRDGLVCGIGPVEAAATTAAALTARTPSAVVHIGIAGGRGVAALAVVVGTESVYSDLAAGIPVVSRLEPAADLLAAVKTALPHAQALSILTSATVGGDHGTPAVEAMEGFGVLRACALAGVPAVEVRVISNEIGEPDRSRWQVAEALEVLRATVDTLAAAASSPGFSPPEGARGLHGIDRSFSSG
jgi:futalosine hydrolase